MTETNKTEDKHPSLQNLREDNYGDYERFRRTPKSELYRQFWKEKQSRAEIADKYNVTERYVRRWFNKQGMRQTRLDDQATYDLRNRFVFEHRPRSHYYELYWGKDMNYKEIAEYKDLSAKTVGRIFRQQNIPVSRSGNKWFDKEAGIPAQFKLSRDEDRIADDEESNPKYADGTSTASASSAKNPKGELPENPNPNDYLAEKPLHRDKDKLYKLHWGYGCSVAHIGAMCDFTRNIRECFDDLGIPYRSYDENQNWEPHHEGVPAMFEWSYDKDDYEDEIDWTLSSQNKATGD